MLQHSVERIFVDKAYGDIYRGVFLVRGESIQMLGEIVSNYYKVEYRGVTVNLVSEFIKTVIKYMQINDSIIMVYLMNYN